MPAPSSLGNRMALIAAGKLPDAGDQIPVPFRSGFTNSAPVSVPAKATVPVPARGMLTAVTLPEMPVLNDDHVAPPSRLRTTVAAFPTASPTPPSSVKSTALNTGVGFDAGWVFTVHVTPETAEAFDDFTTTPLLPTA